MLSYININDLKPGDQVVYNYNNNSTDFKQNEIDTDETTMFALPGIYVEEDQDWLDLKDGSTCLVLEIKYKDYHPVFGPMGLVEVLTYINGQPVVGNIASFYLFRRDYSN